MLDKVLVINATIPNSNQNYRPFIGLRNCEVNVVTSMRATSYREHLVSQHYEFIKLALTTMIFI